MATKYIVNNISGQTINGENILPKYKVFTVLLTQSGGINEQTLVNTDLTIGVTYQILDQGSELVLGDFTNVGAPNNNIGTTFIATDTTPNSWGNDVGLFYNTGVPVAIILENTIGNIWFTYISAGLYILNSENAFPVDKTVFQNTLISIEDGTYLKMITITPKDSNNFYIGSVNFPHTLTNDLLNNTPIEIKIYN